MKRLLLLGALIAAVLVPAAAAAPAATHTLRGTVVAKDRAHHALVVALPGGKVQTLIAPAAFQRTDVGRRVVIRYSALAGQLPVALGVSLEGHARHAVVRGTMVRLVKRHAIINAGGSVLNVTLRAPKKQRSLASSQSGPSAGDSVKVEVEIHNGSLAARAVVVTGAPAGTTAGSDGEMEVRGKVTSLSPLTVATGGTPAVSVGCAIPVGFVPNVKVGDMIELECDLIAGVWTVRVAHDEDDHSSSGDDDSSEVEVRGTLAFSTDGKFVIVTPTAPGSAVTCVIPTGISLAQFLGGDIVKMECVKLGEVLTLKEIEKKGSSGAPSGDDDDDDDDDDEHGDSGEDEK